jgi:hypothetical protein
MLLALFAGYPIYALVAVLSSDVTLVPNTKWEIVLLAALTFMALIGKAMDLGSEGPARRGDPTALKYRSGWGLGTPPDRD